MSRTLFEPFVLNENKQFQLGLSECVDMSIRCESPYYISPNLPIDHIFMQSLKSILFGDFKFGWVNSNLKSGFYLRRLVKAIRANLFLSVIADQWPEIRIIFVIRSPYKVIDSMIEKSLDGWLFEWTVQDILNQKKLVEEWLSPFADRIAKIKTSPERLMLRWCIENYIAINQLQNKNNVLIVSYEQLNQGIGWDAIGAFLFDRGWVGEPKAELLNRPSKTSPRPLVIANKMKFKHLDNDVVSDLTYLLHLFKFVELLPEMSCTWEGYLKSL